MPSFILIGISHISAHLHVPIQHCSCPMIRVYLVA
uniref:Uncharacterized protein n=1 Tax=Anguilla anguilla TaxID=7936 RepID=A0A0E9RGB1_ANGAN